MTIKALKAIISKADDSRSVYVDAETLEDFEEIFEAELDSDGDLILRADLPEMESDEEDESEEGPESL